MSGRSEYFPMISKYYQPEYYITCLVECHLKGHEIEFRDVDMSPKYCGLCIQILALIVL